MRINDLLILLLAERKGLPHKLHKFNKIRHLTSARTDPVYQPCVPKSILSLRLPTDKSTSPDRDALNVRYASDSGGKAKILGGPGRAHERTFTFRSRLENQASSGVRA